MKYSNTLFLILISLIFFSGCAKTPGKTSTKFKIGISAITDIATAGAGGAMMWGTSNKGEAFGTVIQPGSSLDLDLGNGSWTFWAITWEGGGDIYNFKGTTRCAKSGVELTGVSATVAISLSNSNCTSADFAPATTVSGGVYSFPDIVHTECNKISDHNGYACGLNGAAPKSTSKRLIMPSFRRAPNGNLTFTGGALVSECKLSTSSFSLEHLPISNGSIPAMTILQSFFTAVNCDETDPKGFTKEVFGGGLSTPTPTSVNYIADGTCSTSGFNAVACAAFGGTGSCTSVPTPVSININPAVCAASGGVYTSGTIKKFELITTIPDAVLCSGPRVNPGATTPHIFSSGDGSLASPYTICTETQLNKIKGNYSSMNFSLNAELDMNKTSIFGDGSQSSPDCSNNDPSVNFLPIGGLYDASCNEIAAVNYSGTFEGHNHSISNIRMKAKVDTIGFIRYGGTIKNLILNNVDIDGSNNVGAFSGSSPTQLLNLNIFGGKVRGYNSVGGAAGLYTNSISINNVHATNLVVSTNGNSAGGLVGSSNSSILNFTKSSFDGFLKTSSQNIIAGGLVGSAGSSTVSITNSYTNGSGLFGAGNSSSIGGLAGSAATATVTDSYSKMSFGPIPYSFASGTTSYAGGLVGFSGNISFTNSYYLGSIYLPCNYAGTGTTNCAVGALRGNSTATSKINSYGTILGSADWFASTMYDDIGETNFEVAATTTALTASGTAAFFNAGTWAPRLKWESGPCTLPINNLSVATQSGSRGTLANPIIICNRNQWKEIAAYPSLNYALEDNISLGHIALTEMSNFSGVLNGKGHYVSGFFAEVDSSGNGGLFKSTQSSGKIIDTHFSAGLISIPSGYTAASVGLVGLNAGSIINVTIDGVGTEGVAGNQGLLTGRNTGSISLTNVQGIMNIESGHAGFLTGQNDAFVSSSKVSGVMNFSNISPSTSLSGGAIGVNNGTVKEITAGVEIKNIFNSDSSTRIGGLIGENNSAVSDCVIEPHARVSDTTSSTMYAQAFGATTVSSTINRVIAVNDMAIPLSTTAYGKSFVADDNAMNANYTNSFVLKDSYFELNSGAGALTVSSCNLAAGTYTYTMNVPFSQDTNYPDYLYQNMGSTNGNQISWRVSSTHSSGTPDIVSAAGADFQLACGSNGVMSGGQFFRIVIGDSIALTHAGILEKTPAQLGNIETFCPSAVGQSGQYDFKCQASEFDIVEDQNNGIGFNRLVTAYKDLVINKTINPNRPIWTVGDDGYPRLFINND